MTCPIKAATIIKAGNRFKVIIDECAADILGETETEVTFFDISDAILFKDMLQRDLNADYADAC